MNEPATSHQPPNPCLVWHSSDDHIERAAIFSGCGKYRYVLGRRFHVDHWRELFDTPADPRGRVMVNISANPSKASHLEDDATMRRMMDFAKRENCGTFIQLNIGAFIATDPSEWQAAADPVGPDNATWIMRAIKGELTEAATLLQPALPLPPASIVVASWGTLGAFKMLGSKTKWLLRDVPLMCFGTSKSGEYPRHPLYLPKDAKLVPYNEAAKNQPRSREAAKKG